MHKNTKKGGNSKSFFIVKNLIFPKSRRAQITIFIIVSILILAIVAIIFMVSPKLKTSIKGESDNPEKFIQTCLEDSLKETAELIGLQGGSLKPEPNFQYKGNELQYLCYVENNNEGWYKRCSVQIPFIKKRIEQELKSNINEDIIYCENALKDKYSGNLQKGEYLVELLPEKIVLTIQDKFTFTKTDETKSYDKFRVILNNNLYELVAIAQNIMEWETTYGDADPDSYMDIYKNLKVEKYPQIEDTNIYILTDKNTGDKFQFASRSFPFSPSI